jgi:hypothetical protein
MAGLADELGAGIDEAPLKMAEARLAGDDYGPGPAVGGASEEPQ